jgi:hypothetical protein
MKIYGAGPGLGHGNFSLTLYGLASGHPGWQQIFRDYPEARKMPEKARNEFAYRKTHDLIAEDPSRLAKGLAYASKRAFLDFPRLGGWWEGLARAPRTRGLVALFLVAGGLVFLWRARRRPEIAMLSAALGGFLVSVPFLWVDGQARVYAATFPIPALLLSLGVCAWRRNADLPPAEASSPGHPHRGFPLALASACLVAIAAIGPAAAFHVGKTPPAFPVPGSGSRESVVVRSDAPRITVLEAGSGEPTFLPRIRKSDYVRNLPGFGKEDFQRLPLPGAVFYARNWLAPSTANLYGKYIWVVGPAGIAGDKRGYLLLHGTYNGESNIFHVSDFSPLAAPPD